MEINRKAAVYAAGGLKLLHEKYYPKEKKYLIMELFKACNWNAKTAKTFIGKEYKRTLDNWISRYKLTETIEKERLKMIINQARTSPHATTISQLAKELDIKQTTLSQILLRHNKTQEVSRLFNNKILNRVLLKVRENPGITSFEQLAVAIGIRRESFYYLKYDSIRDQLARTFAQRGNRKPRVRKQNRIRRL